MKKTIRLTEEDLHNMVLKAINEAYGTPPQKDNEYEEDLNDNAGTAVTGLPRGLYHLKKAMLEFEEHQEGYEHDKRFSLIMQLTRKAILNAENMVKNEKMRMGLQPDPFYDSRHSKVDYRRNLGSSAKYRGTFHKPEWPYTDSHL